MRCAVEVAPIRSAPRDDAEQVTQALRGERLEVGERRNGWARVITAYAYSGWMREEALCDDDPVSLARSLLGAPYEWGGLSAAGIDCSGLVHLAFRLAGILVPRDAWQLEEAGEPVPAGEERVGDLVTYAGERERGESRSRRVLVGGREDPPCDRPRRSRRGRGGRAVASWNCCNFTGSVSRAA
jgi:cell wall-associated NlpC family hydrolase